MQANMRRVYDPLYGVISLTALEYQIITSPEIQRLRYVRMCNINSLLVTGASEISRFEHIIGVLRLAKEWLHKNGRDLPLARQTEFCAAALLHDFQTGPFGHSMQYVLEDNDSDENFIHDNISHGSYLKFHQSTDASASFCGRPFRCEELLGDSWRNVADLIQGKGNLGQLISGTIDIDNIDNVIRLAYHAGAAKSEDANIAIELARDIIPKNNALEVSIESIRLLEKWQKIRKRLYELLLLDWAEFSAKAMLTKAMEAAIDHKMLGTDSWLRTDLELFYHLEKSSIGEAQEIGDLIKRIRCGDLYHPVYLGMSISTNKYETFSNIQSKREIEKNLIKEINDKLNIKVNLIIHPILDRKKTERAIDVIIRETQEQVQVGMDSNKLLMGIFVSRAIESEEKQKNLQWLIIDFLKGVGLEGLTDIEDPMKHTHDMQMELL